MVDGGKAGQHQQAGTNLSGNLVFDGNLRLANALNNKTHNGVMEAKVKTGC